MLFMFTWAPLYLPYEVAKKKKNAQHEGASYQYDAPHACCESMRARGKEQREEETVSSVKPN